MPKPITPIFTLFFIFNSPRMLFRPGQGDTVFHVEIELPLVAEYFFSDHFSIYGQVGLVVNIVGSKGAVLTPAGGKGVGFTKGFGIGLGNGLSAAEGPAERRRIEVENEFFALSVLTNRQKLRN